MKDEHEITVTINREDGSWVTLLLKATVSGRYHAATLETPAEGPDADWGDEATIEEGEDKDGNPLKAGEKFSLATLTAKERKELEEKAYTAAIDAAARADEAAREDEAERSAEYEREDY